MGISVDETAIGMIEMNLYGVLYWISGKFGVSLYANSLLT